MKWGIVQKGIHYYSMGAGTYLTNKDFIRCGWSVRKVRFWREDSKAVYVPLGELAQAVQA